MASRLMNSAVRTNNKDSRDERTPEYCSNPDRETNTQEEQPNKPEKVFSALRRFKKNKQAQPRNKNNIPRKPTWRSGKDSGFSQNAEILKVHNTGNVTAAFTNGRNKESFVISRKTLHPWSEFLKKSDIVKAAVSDIKTPKSKTIAKDCSIIQLRAERSVDEVGNFFTKTLTQLMKEKRTLNQKKNFIAFLKCEPVWQYFLNYQASGRQFHIICRKKILIILKIARLKSQFKFYVTQFLRKVLKFEIISSNNIDIDKSKSSMLVCSLRNLYTIVAELVPEHCPKIVTLMENLANGTQRSWINCIKISIKNPACQNDDFSRLDWNELPSMPTQTETEMHNNRGVKRKLNQVKVTAPYPSTFDYLDTYFRLLREDSNREIREIISKQAFIVPQDNLKVKRFDNLSFEGIAIDKGIHFVMNVMSKDQTQTFLKKCDLQHGNLVYVMPNCLRGISEISQQPSSFELKPFFATISLRVEKVSDMKKYSICFTLEVPDGFWEQIDLFNLTRQLHLLSGNISLVESNAYFRAFEPVLENFKSLESENLAFTEQLVFLRSAVRTPEYLLTDEHLFNTSCVFHKSVAKMKTDIEIVDETSTSLAIEKLDSNDQLEISFGVDEGEIVDNSVAESTDDPAPTEQLTSDSPLTNMDTVPNNQNDATDLLLVSDDEVAEANATEKIKQKDEQLNVTASTPRKKKRTEATFHELLETLEDSSDEFGSCLDESQKSAMAHILQSHISIVQGPPGCGKTYLGAKFVELITSFHPQLSKPILLLTYKNHALDEFILRVLKFLRPSEVCRIGGRSKEPKIEETTLRSKKESSRTTDGVARRESKKKEQSILNELRKVFDSYHITEDEFVEKFLSSAQITGLLKGAPEIPLTFLKDTQNWELNLTTIRHKIKQINIDGIVERAAVRFKPDRPDIDIRTMIVSRDRSISDSDEIDDLRTVFYKILEKWLPTQNQIEHLRKRFVSQKNPKRSNEKPVTSQAVDSLSLEEDLDDTKWDEIRELNYSLEFQSSRKDSKKDTNKQLDRLKQQSILLGGNENKSCLYPLPFAPQLCDGLDFKALNVDNLWSLTPVEKVKLIQCCLLNPSQDQFYDATQNDNSELITEYLSDCVESKEEEYIQNATLLQKCRFIGMTITGASINRQLLDLIQPSIVIVEEAAEVLEANLIPVLKSYVEHLVLIGDHKQLRPRVEVHELVREYNFDVSMMERLIKGKMQYVQLKCQNRMRPQISKYLRHIYPELEDGPKTFKIKPVPLFETSFLFWTHSHPETGDRSYSNLEEAVRCAKLTHFLLQQGYKTSQITILAAYLGQKSLIKRKYAEICKSSTDPKSSKGVATEDDVQIQTIDMYQGDENDIVIVSLVRSNDKMSFGFMRLPNRLCVAQSRAKRQVIFIGNAEFFKKCTTWANFLESLSCDNAVSTCLTIVCPKEEHRDRTRILVKDSSSFPAREFCREICGMGFEKCSHTCKKFCKPDHDHLECRERVDYTDLSICAHKRSRLCFYPPFLVECKRRCEYVLPKCNHQCENTCEPQHSHESCQKSVQDLCQDCGNNLWHPCCVPVTNIECQTLVRMACKKCNKFGTKKCHESVDLFKCIQNCEKLLECGHQCELKCLQDCSSVKCAKCEEEQKKKDEQSNREFIQLHLELEELKKLVTNKDKINDLQEVLLPGCSDTYDKHNQVVTKFTDLIGHEQLKSIHIEKIVKILNKNLVKRFNKSLKNMNDVSNHELKLYEVDSNQVEDATKNGIKYLSSKTDEENIFGRVVCFKELPELQFSTESCIMTDETNTESSLKALIICNVAVGKFSTITKKTCIGKKLLSEPLLEDGFDSVKIDCDFENDHCQKELLIFKSDRILPQYVLYVRKAEFNDPCSHSRENASEQPSNVEVLDEKSSSVIQPSLSTNSSVIAAEDVSHGCGYDCAKDMGVIPESSSSNDDALNERPKEPTNINDGESNSPKVIKPICNVDSPPLYQRSALEEKIPDESTEQPEAVPKPYNLRPRVIRNNNKIT
ncbi:NFX1-type zinc finger-containing protein 1-like isoform X1 [Convolutriloba macropyga]|uniref:NFX1-type zinc finger-containing protein 1-like isoform X1 n=1 Tax=Convolutriloba macropyga TaxID=536237 RepID=UPI003F5201EF